MPNQKKVKPLKTAATTISNPRASRLPSQRGAFGQPEPVAPISAKPRKHVGERVKPSKSVRVTNEKAGS